MDSEALSLSNYSIYVRIIYLILVGEGLCLILLPDTDRNLDSKPNGCIVLYRNCSHCTDSDLDSDPHLDLRSLLYSFLGWISMPGSGFGSVSGNVNTPLCLITLPDLDSDSCIAYYSHWVWSPSLSLAVLLKLLQWKGRCTNKILVAVKGRWS